MALYSYGQCRTRYSTSVVFDIGDSPGGMKRLNIGSISAMPKYKKCRTQYSTLAVFDIGDSPGGMKVLRSRLAGLESAIPSSERHSLNCMSASRQSPASSLAFFLLFRRRRRRVYCAGMGVPVLNMTASERRSF